MAENNQGGSERGFAALDVETRREIAAKGGRSQGKANNPGNFANNPERAAAAGRKGGMARESSSSEESSDSM